MKYKVTHGKRPEWSRAAETIEEARDFARAILAAADWAERRGR